MHAGGPMIWLLTNTVNSWSRSRGCDTQLKEAIMAFFKKVFQLPQFVLRINTHTHTCIFSFSETHVFQEYDSNVYSH